MSRKSKALEFVNEGYNITIRGHQVQITDAMKDYATEKVSKIERLTNRVMDVLVVMDIQKLEHRVDIVLKVDHITINSSASTDDMYASIDKAVDKLLEQFRRYKSKIQDHHARGIKVIDMNVNVLRPIDVDEVVEVNTDIEEENRRIQRDEFGPHQIVAQEKIPLRTLNHGEAIMKLQLSGDAFLIFVSEEDRKLKVIYKRNDGNFGIIEAEK